MNLRKAIEELEAGGKNVRFDRLLTIVEAFFGRARVTGSHHTISLPWRATPVLVIQPRKDGKAKEYQTKQVLGALRNLAETEPSLLEE